MYKATQSNKDFMNRTASHATKPHANGRVEDIPVWAAEPEEYYQTQKQQYEEAKRNLDAVERQVQDLKFRLRTTMPRAEFDKVSAEHQKKGALMQHLQKTTGDMRAMVRAAAVNSWGATYYYCAIRILPFELRLKLDAEVTDLLGRNMPTDGIGRAKSEMSDGRRATDHRKRDLDALRDRQNPSRRKLVWSDELDGHRKPHA